MPDPLDPSEPASTTPPVSSTEPVTATSSGLPSNIAAALACFPLLGGVIFLILEKRDRFVRFYAMQSIIFGAAWMLFRLISRVVHAILWELPGLGHFLANLWRLISGFVELGFVVILVVAIIKAFTGVRWDIPYIGPVARKQIDPPAA